jgi:hypothetical protein
LGAGAVGVRRVAVLVLVLAASLLGTSASLAALVTERSKPPAGYHTVTIKKFGISLAVPNGWKAQSRTGSGPYFAAGDVSTGKDLLAGLKAKGVKYLPADRSLQDITIAGKPGKVGTVTGTDGTVATSFYLLSMKGAVLIVCTGPTDARQDPTFQTIINNVQLT